MLPAFLSNNPFLLHLLLLAVSLLLSSFLPSVLLSSLHTYLLPDQSPSPPPQPRNKSRSIPTDPFSSASAQLLRLPLSAALLPSKPYFPLLRLLLLLPPSALLLLLLPLPSSAVPPVVLLLSLPVLLLPLLLPSPSPIPRPLSAASAALAPLLLLPRSLPLLLAAAAVAFAVPTPAARAARAFWIATDQPRYGLDLVRSGPAGRLLAYTALLAGSAAAIAGPSRDRGVPAVAAAAVAQLLAVRTNVQMHLNEGVLVWYQRLHSGKVPDLSYGRAKVFLQDHYLCLAAVHFYAPPALALLLACAARLGDGFFCAGMPWVAGCGGEGFASFAREACAFLAWWVVLIWTAFAMGTVALLRCGFMYVS